MLNPENCDEARMKAKLEDLSASEFKARCLKVLDELEPQRVIVTKRGRPVAKVIPLPTAQNADLIGCIKG